MKNRMENVFRHARRALIGLGGALVAVFASPLLGAGLLAQEGGQGTVRHGGGEVNLVIPDLSSVSFLGVNGHSLLTWGLLVCALGLIFALVIYSRLKNLPVHQAMLDISELIYETCKTYLQNQGKFILLLWLFIGAIAAIYFGALASRGSAFA